MRLNCFLLSIAFRVTNTLLQVNGKLAWKVLNETVPLVTTKRCQEPVLDIFTWFYFDQTTKHLIWLIILKLIISTTSNNWKATLSKILKTLLSVHVLSRHTKQVVRGLNRHDVIKLTWHKIAWVHSGGVTYVLLAWLIISSRVSYIHNMAREVTVIPYRFTKTTGNVFAILKAI